MKRLLILMLLTCASFAAFGQTAAFQNKCFLGGTPSKTSGLNSSNYLDGVIPHCTVTVYLTGTLTKATIYADSSNTPLANPFLANTLTSVNPGGWIFWAAEGQGYDVVMNGGDAPNTYPQPVTLVDLLVPTGGGGGGGGCGPLANDTTSTNCGTNNLASPPGGPAYLQAYGTNNLNSDSGTHNVAAGDANLNTLPSASPGDLVGIGSGNISSSTGGISQLVCMGLNNCTTIAWLDDSVGIGQSNFQHNAGTSVSNALSESVAIGLANVQYVNSGATVIGIGQANSGGAVPGGSNNISSIVGIGDSGASNMGNNVADVVAIGDAPAFTIVASSHDIVAIGDAADKQCQTFTGCTPSVPNPVLVNDVVAVGDGPLTFNQGHDVIGIGNGAMGSNSVGATAGYYNQGAFNDAIGSFALLANSTGANNVALGSYAGADGFVAPNTWGNSNHTGSNNTWIGYDSGPHVTTQLSNSSALGYQAANDASNQIVLGNGSVTQFRVPGIRAATTTSCVQIDVAGNLSNTGAACGSGSGAVNSVTNSDGTLTISPTTGAVVASIALGHANTWTATQTFSGIIDSAISAGTAPICPNGTGGAFTTTGCSGAASGAWSALTNPTGNLGLTMGADTSTFTYSAATGSSDLYALTDTASNTGTGIMLHVHTQSGSTEIPFQSDSNGVGWKVGTDGSLASVGATLAATMDWGQGTAPGAAPTTAIQMYAPTSVTGYNLVLPGTVATSGNTFLSCTAASPSVCSWAAGGGLTNPMTAVGDMIVGGTAGAPTRLALTAPGGGGVILAATGFATSPGWLSFENGSGTLALGSAVTGNFNTILGQNITNLGNDSTVVGDSAGSSSSSNDVTAIGQSSVFNTGSNGATDTTAVGISSGPQSKTCVQCGFLGSGATTSVTGLTNAWAWGYNVSVGASNTQIFGNSSIVSTVLQGFTQFPALESTGTVFTVSACGTPTATGGAAAGTFAAGSATCNPVITPGYTAAHGWTCVLQDETTAAASFRQSAHSTTTATLAGTGVVSSDVIDVMCMAY